MSLALANPQGKIAGRLYLYFLRIGREVKIGCTSLPGDRIRYFGKRAILLGCVRGDFKAEKEAHRKMRLLYKNSEKGKEWFLGVPGDFDPLSVVDGPLLNPRYVLGIRGVAEHWATPNSHRMSFWVSYAMADELKREAKREGVLFSCFLEKLVYYAWEARKESKR